MALVIHPFVRPVLGVDDLAPWSSIPTAIISDERNRAGATDASIRAVTAGRTMVGQAFTVAVMAADNLAVHHAIAVAFPGAVLAIDAGGYMKNAVWGGITHRAAELRTLGGIVIDGCIRDAAEIRASALPCYAAGVVPAGPHKGWGGTINGPIQIGGCPVQPGDILVGDDDGIAVVPFDERGELLQRCVARMAFEESVLHRLDGGESTVEILDLRA